MRTSSTICPLLVRHLDPLGPSRRVEQFAVRCRRALGERRGEARLGLPRLGEVDALALDDDLRLACQPGERRLEGLCVVHLEQPRRRLPQLRQRQEDVAVAGRLGEHEEEARAQPLRRVELDAERARNAVGHAETDPRHLGQPVRIVLEHGDHVRPVRADEPRGEARADPVREQERLDLADGSDLTPRLDRPLHRATRDRAARLRPHLPQPLRIAIEFGEDVLRAEMLDDRTRKGRANARNATPQPERNSLRRLRQGRAERRNGELPAVTLVPLDRAGNDDALPGGNVAKTAAQRDRPPVLERSRPDRELAVRRNPARPARRKRHRELADIRVNRRLILDDPHASRLLGLPRASPSVVRGRMAVARENTAADRQRGACDPATVPSHVRAPIRPGA